MTSRSSRRACAPPPAAEGGRDGGPEAPGPASARPGRCPGEGVGGQRNAALPGRSCARLVAEGEL